MMRRLRQPTTLPAMGLALCLLTTSCIGAGSSDDDAAPADTTGVPDGDGADASGEDAAITTTTAAETGAPVVDDLTDVAWVVNDFDGLVDDQGRILIPAPSEIFDDRRPSVVRATDGSIHYRLDGRLWRWAVDAAGPEEVDDDTDEILGTDAADGADGADDGGAITATNGVTVRVLGPDVDVDEFGYVTEFRSPARLEVERNGEIEWAIDAGGVGSPWLDLVDFDGRFVMMARYPGEPADPMLQHIVYDLRCPGNDAVRAECTRTFHARWGTAALVGPDVDSADLNIEDLDICPTQGVEIARPAEMTDPNSFDEDFTADDLEAFRLAALQLATCDPTGLGDPNQPGLRYVSAGNAPEESGWMWTAFAQSLQGPFIPVGGTVVWSRHEGGPSGVLDRSFSPARFRLQPGRRFDEPLAATITPDSILVVGRTDAETAERVLAGALSVADDRGVALSNWIDTSGIAQPEDRIDAFVGSIETDVFADDLTGEIHLTTTGVIRDLRSPAEPTTAERNLGFLMADFASGGEGVYAELPLAPNIVVALGSQVVARRQVTELFRRSAWAVNSADYAGRVGPFNVLDLVPSPSEVVVGPHARCAGPEAIPSPPELATYTRIGILPLAGSIDSCLDWSAVDLFVDDGGVIRGVAVHLEEP